MIERLSKNFIFVLIFAGIVFLLILLGRASAFLFDFSYFQNFQKLSQTLNETWLNPTWLNENQGLLSAVSIVIAVIPFYTFIIVKILNWKKNHTQKIVQSARSLYIVGSIFFSLKKEIKNFLEIINKNQQEKNLHQFSKLPVLLKTYGLGYYLKAGVIDIFDEKQEKIGFETGLVDIIYPNPYQLLHTILTHPKTQILIQIN